MKKILNYIILGVFIATVYSCDEDATSNSVNYLTFESGPVAATVDVGQGSSTTDVAVYAGNKSGSDRTFNVMVDTDASTADPSAYSVPSSVTIPGGSSAGALPITLNESGLDFLASTIVLQFMDNQGMFTGDAITVNASLVCPDASQFTFAVTTDNWPDETSWDISDSSGVIASGGPYDNPADDFATITQDLCLLAGTYTVNLYDSYGDGGSSFDITSNSTGASVASGDATGGAPANTPTTTTVTFTVN